RCEVTEPLQASSSEATEPKPPSWWQYVAGRDHDKKWAAFYASTIERGGDFSSKSELDFYLNVIKRLAADAYPKPAHRPPDAVNFWLTCHYQLRVQSGSSTKAAAIDTARIIAAEATIAKGHTPKAIQRHAKRLQQPASEFLAE